MSDSTLSKVFLLVRRLVCIACRNPAGLRPVFGHALAEAENHLDREHDISRLPVVSLAELVGQRTGPIEIVTGLFPQVTHSISLIEAFSLGALLQTINAKRVFEFGTNRGVSTTQLALNVGPNGHVFTLDLPRQNRETKFDIRLAGDVEVARQTEKADLVPERCRSRITFLEQDSATFDESEFAGTMDAVFVDGAHIFEYVRNDSTKGWRMLRPGGILIWHDFRPLTPDVMRYVFESNSDARRIEGTTLAFARKSTHP